MLSGNMKLLTAFLTITLLSSMAFSQYLSFTSDETLMPGQIGEVTTMHGEIHNLMDSTLIVTCEFDTTGYPADWYFSWCSGENCWPPFIFSVNDTIPGAGVLETTVYLTPNSTPPDQATVVYSAFPVGAPSAIVELSFTVDLNLAVEGQNVSLQPKSFNLNPAYPNPFNPGTTVSYTIGRQGIVQAAVYNLLGKQVQTLVSGLQTPGLHQIEWNGCDFNGVELPSGTYYIQVGFNGTSQTMPVVKLK